MGHVQCLQPVVLDDRVAGSGDDRDGAGNGYGIEAQARPVTILAPEIGKENLVPLEDVGVEDGV